MTNVPPPPAPVVVVDDFDGPELDDEDPQAASNPTHASVATAAVSARRLEKDFMLSIGLGLASLASRQHRGSRLQSQDV